MDTPAVLCAYKRSPFHFAGKGALARVRPDDMAVAVMQALLEETGVDPAQIEDLILGCAFPEGEQGFNLARIVVQLAGLPDSIAGITVNRFCASSMSAIQIAAGAIGLGAGGLFLCGGVESMSRVPMGGFNPLPNPKMADIYPAAYMGMGETAENLARKYGIPRDEQDAFALDSHRKAAAARDSGRFADEIVSVAGVDADGCIRPETTADALAGLKPAFDEKGTVTAGSASPLTDGCAGVLVVAEETARTLGLPVLARVRSVAVAGCAADIMGIGPVPAVRKALERAGVALADIDLIELNEAFAVQSLAVIRELGMDPERVNVDGGAIALGHPLGASGARITGKLAALMKREGKALGLATMCVGGGQGAAVVLEAA